MKFKIKLKKNIIYSIFKIFSEGILQCSYFLITSSYSLILLSGNQIDKNCRIFKIGLIVPQVWSLNKGRLIIDKIIDHCRWKSLNIEKFIFDTVDIIRIVIYNTKYVPPIKIT